MSVFYYDKHEDGVTLTKVRSLLTISALEKLINQNDIIQLFNYAATIGISESALVAVGRNKTVVLYWNKANDKIEIFNEVPKHVTMLIMAAT